MKLIIIEIPNNEVPAIIMDNAIHSLIPNLNMLDSPDSLLDVDEAIQSQYVKAKSLIREAIREHIGYDIPLEYLVIVAVQSYPLKIQIRLS